MRRVLLAVALGALAACQPEAPAPSEMRISPTGITVSGMSAGGYMAMQLHVAMSDRISGVATLGAGPYWCSMGQLPRALSTCMAGGDIRIDELTHHARDAAAAGKIPTLNHLRDARVWVFHGRADPVISADVVYAAVDFYEQLGDGRAVKYIDEVDVTHGFPTESAGGDCKTMATPFINACGYDGAGELLKFLLDRDGTADAAVTGEYRVIDQREFSAAGLADEALLYVPPQCAGDKECGLHVALHGCQQSTEFVERQFVENAGYNRWADAFDLVVLYPQVRASSADPANPLGCWDWWGYTGSDFASASGPQIVALTSLIDGLTGSPP
ncbi:MAG: PHB depolymerase family esterase [Pseudomonadota bacterium]